MITPEMQKILREPFPPEQIGVLPRVSCSDCKASGTGACQRHKRGKCVSCKQYISDAHIHLSYVGHAAVTDRLLKADPTWSWTPAYRNVDPTALAAAASSGNPEIVAQVIAAAPPARDEAGGLSILMTVGGVTRPGYGTSDNRGSDRYKMLVSDAIRNAAMRFGVALDLWSKEDLADSVPATDFQPQGTRPPAPPGRDWIGEAAAAADIHSLLQLSRQATEAGANTGHVHDILARRRQELRPTQSATPQRGTAR